VTQAIVYLTVAIHLIRFLSDNADIELFQRLALAAGNVDQGELWRLVSHALLHSTGNLLHIFFNMYILYLFGPSLERGVGSVPFATFYVAAAAAGGSAFVILEQQSVAVGASGAIFGLFGAWILASWKARHTPAGRAQFNQFAFLLAINLALPFFIPRVAWQAHLGGLVAGLAIAWGWQTMARGSSNPKRDATLVAAAVLAISLLAGALLV
jgi:membrane associated rhomboid family serine protease